MSSKNRGTMEIVSAPWVIPVDTAVIKTGAVVCGDGRIVDIGGHDQIVRRYPNLMKTHYPGVLMPGLVNGHMHLELSHLQDIPKLQPEQNFTDWISALLAKRMEVSWHPAEIVERFMDVLGDQYNSGVILIGDIGNDYFEELHSAKREFVPEILRMLEFLGPNLDGCNASLEKIEKLDDSVTVTGHGPYSTGPELLKKIKTRCRRLHQLFSVHTAESRDELDFIRTGCGCFRDFLEMRNSWDGMFLFDKTDFSGTVEYFDYLDILDQKTLLVHCVHVSDSEIMLIRERGAHICLCPGSNRFLGVGIPPVERMVAEGLLPCLGTDSLASNSVADLWGEIQLMTNNHPQLDHYLILAMATSGGAKALGFDDNYGSLAIGKKATILHVSSESLKGCRDADKLVKTLVSDGRPAEIEWLPTFH